MEEFKVLITTSGLGSRLGELTDYTNKSLVRINDKPSLSHIIESYDKKIEFVITLGHFGSHVKQFLNLAYPEHKFTFVEIDNYQGAGSSLGYSILKCRDVLNCPFIFHASDTIVTNYEYIKPDYNYIIGSNKEDSSQFRTIRQKNGKLIRVNEKGEMNQTLSYIGVSGIRDHQLFFDVLENLVKIKIVDLSDVHCINEMVTTTNFRIYQVTEENWFDVGNVTELNRTKKKLPKTIDVLDKKEESIFMFNDFVIKFFSDINMVKSRVDRAKDLEGIIPKIEGHTENFYKYKKVKGLLFSNSVKPNTFRNLLQWSKKNLWEKRNDNKIKDKCQNFYLSKTKKRISEYLQNNSDSNFINNEFLPDIYDLIEEINFRWLCNGIPSRFHGDFILDNIIETNDGFSLIDWRQDFDGDLYIGDLYYDIAKLNHNLTVNHSVLNRELFSWGADNCQIYTSSILNECKEILEEFITNEGLDLKKVNVLTSLIWINMSPLHEYPLNNFLYNFGKYNLFKNIKK